MVRIRLVASCLADPTGIKFAGYEVEMTDDAAAAMVATGQWQYVAAPGKGSEVSSQETGARAIGSASATASAGTPPVRHGKGNREYRGRSRPPLNPAP